MRRAAPKPSTSVPVGTTPTPAPMAGRARMGFMSGAAPDAAATETRRAHAEARAAKRRGAAATFAQPPTPVADVDVRAVAAKRAADAARVDLAARAATDQRVVAGLVLAFLVAVIVAMSVTVIGDMRNEQALTEMSSTFQSVHVRQQMFRMLNLRFATWSELAANGAGLPASQEVRRSAADSSHWFMSLVDRDAGMICDRTGELFDESPDERRPVCRKLDE